MAESADAESGSGRNPARDTARYDNVSRRDNPAYRRSRQVGTRLILTVGVIVGTGLAIFGFLTA